MQTRKKSFGSAARFKATASAENNVFVPPRPSEAPRPIAEARLLRSIGVFTENIVRKLELMRNARARQG